MNRIFLIITLFALTNVQANESHYSSNDTVQVRIEKFLSGHEVSSSTFYCRADIATPECRVLMRYKCKATGRNVKSFQIAFNAHFRQVGGTEYFIENYDGTFMRASDGTMDGKVNPVLDEEKQVVEISHKHIKIKDIKFGTLIADLLFNNKLSEVRGVNNGQPVLLTYPRVK
jgi:hypothetical protein